MRSLLVSVGLLSITTAVQAETTVFFDDFEDGAAGLKSRWEERYENGGEIAIGEAGSLGKVVCISRNERNGLTFIMRRLPKITGNLRVEAKIKADNVLTGSRDFEGGQFHAVIIVNNREVAWPKSQFEGSFGWTTRSFDVYDLTPNKSVLLRIGLQEGRGTVCINDVRVTQIQ